MASKSEVSIRVGTRRLSGMVLVPISVFVVLSLFFYNWEDIGLLKAPPNAPPANPFGPVGAWLSFLLLSAFGVGAYLLPVFGLLMAGIFMFSLGERVWPRVAWCSGLALALIAATELLPALWVDACRNLNIADAGGVFGHAVTRAVLIRWTGPVGARFLVWLVAAVAAAMAVGPGAWVALWKRLLDASQRLSTGAREAMARRREDREEQEREKRRLDRHRERMEQEMEDQKRKAAQPKIRPLAEKPDPAAGPAAPRAEPQPPKVRPAPDRASPTPTERVEPAGPFQLPPVSLLASVSKGKDRSLQADTQTTSRIITETLGDFGIEAQVTNVEAGPVVTRYELLPAPGVRVERISGLSNNLALSLKATSVRVQAPIPGKGVIGIEVPNTAAKIVYLREIIEGEAWQLGKARLPLVLGKDVGGTDIVADLTEMPHLLIAGATGSGKTVCMNAVLAGLLMSRTPQQLRLMLVDPKIVEFSPYNHLPHLIVPVITDPRKVAIGLRWAINEMEGRYKLFARVGVRNIEGYNQREIVRQASLFGDDEPEAGRDEPPDRLPFIVIVIDELADLMLVAQADVETCIARLAQLSRAVGIHMIIATQRPSVNVITGTIKANFPARIAFQVAQKVDSRTILDTVGAEKLLGRGDMLLQPPGTSKLVRAQGAFTTDAEIRSIVDFCKEQGEPEYEVEIRDRMEKKTATDEEADEEDDDLINQAVEIIRETHRASTSSLQRRLRIGYTRAARIMDILEERGIIGPPRGSDPREILIDLDGQVPGGAAEEEDGPDDPDGEEEERET